MVSVLDTLNPSHDTSSEAVHVKTILLGGQFVGKSSCGNTILNKDAFSIGKPTICCILESNKVADMKVTVVDTPRWSWCSTEDPSDQLKEELKRSVEMLGEGPHTFLLVYPLGAHFIERHKIVVDKHLKLFGDDAWDRTMVLFTRGDWLGDRDIGEHIEKVDDELKWLLEKCKNRYHVLNNKAERDEAQIVELLEKILSMNTKRRRSRDHQLFFVGETSDEADPGDALTKHDLAKKLTTF